MFEENGGRQKGVLPMKRTRGHYLMLCLTFWIAGLVLAGCGDGKEVQLAEEETVVKSMEEYRKEAAQEITTENAEAELERLRKEIEADIEQEE